MRLLLHSDRGLGCVVGYCAYRGPAEVIDKCTELFQDLRMGTWYFKGANRSFVKPGEQMKIP